MRAIVRALRVGTGLVLLLAAQPVHASGSERLIPPEQVPAVVALFEPIAPGDEVHAGFVLENIEINGDAIRVELLHDDGRMAAVVLRRAQAGEEASTTSFVFEREPAEGDGKRAIELVLDRVRANDHGGIYSSSYLPKDPHRNKFAEHGRAPWLALLALFAGIAVAGRALGPGAARAGEPSPSLSGLSRRSNMRLMTLFAAFVIGFFLLMLVGPEPVLHHDSLQDYQHAQDCLLGPICPSHATSLEGVRQGRTLIVILAALLASGASLGVQHAFFVALQALGATIIMQLAARLFSARTAWPAFFTALSLGAWASDHPIIWNPTLAPLPLALFFFALASLAVTGAGRWIWFAGVAAVFAVHAHPAHYVLTPILAFAAAATTPGWYGATLGTLIVPLLLVCLDPTWAIKNIIGLQDYGRALPVAALGVVAALAGLIVRRRWRALAPLLRGRLAAIAPGIALFGAVVIAAAAIGKEPGARYWAGAIPSIAVAAGMLAARSHPLRIAAYGLASVCVYFGLQFAGIYTPKVYEGFTLTLIEAAKVVDHAAALGYARNEAFSYLQGPDFVGVAEAGNIGAELAPPAHAVPDRSLRYLVLDDEEVPKPLPQGWSAVALGHGRTDLYSEASVQWVARQRFDACVLLDDGERKCRSIGPEDRFGGEGRTAHTSQADIVLDEGQRVARWEQDLPINVNDDARSHIIFLATGWEVLRVDGLAHEIAPDARSVVLTPGTDRVGILTVGHISEGEHSGRAHTAVAIEMLPTEGALLETIGRKHMF